MTVGTAEVVEPTLSLATTTSLASATRPWPAGSLTRREVVARLHSAEVSTPKNRSAHRVGIELAVDWLDQQPGGSWQERWLASGVENDAAVWRATPLRWLAARGHGACREDGFFRALRLLIGLDIIRPSMGWLVAARFTHGSLTQVMARHRDPAGFARLESLCASNPDVAPAGRTRTTYRAAMMLAAKGGLLADITTDDVLELLGC